MLHYTTYNHPTSTQWVTFVHGAGGSSSVWFRQIKAFKEKYNVLLVDLRGHGKSKLNLKTVRKYSFEFVAQDVVEVLDHLKIQSSHFIGISLGTILIREIAEKHPEKVDSMLLAGAILKLNFQSQILMKVGYWLKAILPYMLLYRLFAFIILPRKKHKPSRNIFVKEAKKLYQKEFMKWYKLTTDVNKVLKIFRQKTVNVPTLFVMGDEDYMFLPPIKDFVGKNPNSDLVVIPNCGHIVNVEAYEQFNNTALGFIK